MSYEKLVNPLPTSLGSACYSVVFSSDSLYLLTGHTHATNRQILICIRDGDIFQRETISFDNFPIYFVSSVAFSPDLEYVAAGSEMGDYIYFYKRREHNFTKLPKPTSTPSGRVYGVDFSNCGEYLAVASYSSSGSPFPQLGIYKRNLPTFTKLPNPVGGVSAGQGYAVNFSHDDTYLAVGYYNSPYFAVFKRDGDTFTKLPDPLVLPAGAGRGVKFSHDSTYLAVAHEESPFITIYKRDGDTFTKLPDPLVLPTGTGRGVDFSLTLPYLAVAHAESPFITIYKRDGDTFTKLPDPLGGFPPNHGLSVAFSPYSTYLAIAHTTAPYITIYKKPPEINTTAIQEQEAIRLNWTYE